MRPIVPSMPFGVPDSKRPLNPMMPLGARGSQNGVNGNEAGFNNTDAAGNPIAPIVNSIVSFGWEYVWHCHILSHEEMDMMRPQQINVNTALPAAPTLTKTGTPGSPIALSWTDGTPVDYAVPASWGKPVGNGNEIRYGVERAPISGGVTGAYVEIASVIANTTTYSDTTTVAGSSYSYRVVAYSAAGGSNSNAVTVTPPIVVPTIQVTAPNVAGLSFFRGTSTNITWTASPAVNTLSFRVWVRKLSNDSYTQVAASVPATGAASYSRAWTVNVSAATDYRARVQYMDAVGNVLSWDESNNSFSVVNPPTIQVTSPNLTVTWLRNSTHNITWTVSPAVNTLNFRVYVINNNTQYYQIGALVPATGSTSYSRAWTITQPAGTNYRARIQYLDAVGNVISWDQSNETFIVQ
jgi:hypothetical protein